MMPILRAWSRRVRSMFRKEQLDRELNDESASHLEMHIANNLRSGMTPEAVRRDALLKLGGVEQTKESIRGRRGIPFLEILLQDLRCAFRTLRKDRDFTALASLPHSDSCSPLSVSTESSRIP